MSALPSDPVMTERSAAEKLSELLLRDGIGPECQPEAIIRLFKNHWGKLSVLGHSLHNAQERIKQHEETMKSAAAHAVRGQLDEAVG